MDLVSPDGFFWAGFSQSVAPELWYLPPGSDSVAGVFDNWPEGEQTPYPAGPSFMFVFHVNHRAGTFEIDTCCVCFFNHLQGADTTNPDFVPVLFSFTRGVVTIRNTRPVLEPIGPKQDSANQLLRFRVSASDSNLSPPALQAAGLPAGADFTDSANGAGAFSWTPGAGQAGTYNVTFNARDSANPLLVDSEVVDIRIDAVSAVVIALDGDALPTDYALAQNYPNPFNANTVIRFALPHDAVVTLTIFNILGQGVRNLIGHQTLTMGVRAVQWDAADDTGRPVPSGMYFYRLETKDFVQTRPMVLLK